MLISWLAETIDAETKVKQKSKSETEDKSERIFKHVANGRLDKAVQCALENGKFLTLCFT